MKEGPEQLGCILYLSSFSSEYIWVLFNGPNGHWVTPGQPSNTLFKSHNTQAQDLWTRTAKAEQCGFETVGLVGAAMGAGGCHGWRRSMGPWWEEGHGAMGTGGGGPWTDSKSASTMYSEPILATEWVPNTNTFWAYFSSYGTNFV